MMGRKPDGAQPRSRYVGARITPAGREQLERVLRDGETESSFVRDAIRREIERRAAIVAQHVPAAARRGTFLPAVADEARRRRA